GPWSSSISLPVDAGGTATQSFFYEDTKAGSPMLTAAAPGYTSATQTETVAAASLSSIAISPSSLQLKVGSRATLKATGPDSYGNPVAVSPAWSVTPALGTFSSASGAQTTFSAKTAGFGTIAATVGSVTGTAAVSVAAKKR